MNEMSFFAGLWNSVLIIFIASFGVFFAKSIKNITMASCLALTGISLMVINADLFRGIFFGQFIVIVLWSLFLFQCLFFQYLLKNNIQKTPFFYGLPFLGFITMAISLDLITFLLAMSIFATSFIGLSFLRQQNKSRLIASFQKLCVSFLSFGIGLACLYSREGTLYLKDLYLKLHKGNWDGLTYVGFWMLFLSVFIEVYAIIPLIGKKNDV